MASSNALNPGGIGGSVASGEGKRRVKIIRAPSLSLRELWQSVRALVEYRDLFYTLSAHRIKVRYKQSMLGFAWAIVQPFALMLIYTLIFSIVTRMPSEGTPYAVFAYAALLPWTSFSNALTSGTNSLVSHSHLVTKVYFPREILPATYVVASLFDLAVGSSVLALMMLYYKIVPTVLILWAVPIITVMTVFTLGVTLILSALQVYFRDIGMAMPLLMQLWLFASPVVYPLSAVPAWLYPVYVLNPMVGLTENFRRVILQGMAPDLRALAVAAIVSAVLLPASYILFKRLEATLADVV